MIRQNVDEILAELDARFGADQSSIMRAAACSLPSSQNFLSKQKLNIISKLYTVNIKDSELEVFRSFIDRQDVSQLETLIDVLDIIDKDIFPYAYNLHQILVTIPQPSCKVERMFSYVKRIKTPLRSQMTTERLSNLALLSIEKDVADSLRYSDVIEHFKRMKHRRLLL